MKITTGKEDAVEKAASDLNVIFRKAAALDFLLEHPYWMTDNMPALACFTVENVLGEIEAAMHAEHNREASDAT